jgi:ADP-ribose diphosphatase
MEQSMPTSKLCKENYKGAIYTDRTEEISFPDGKKITRDVIVKNEVAVALVHNIDTDTVVLIREFRVGSMKYELGGVAGIVEVGEYPMNAIVRELVEETGYSDTVIVQSLGTTMTSSGFTNEKVHHFYIKVRGLRGDQNLDADESIEVIERPFGDIAIMMANGEITSNHLHACLLKLMMNNGYEWV